MRVHQVADNARRAHVGGSVYHPPTPLMRKPHIRTHLGRHEDASHLGRTSSLDMQDKQPCPQPTSALAVAQPVPSPHLPLGATRTRRPPCLGYRGTPPVLRASPWRIEGNICSISQRPAGMIVINDSSFMIVRLLQLLRCLTQTLSEIDAHSRRGHGTNRHRDRSP